MQPTFCHNWLLHQVPNPHGSYVVWVYGFPFDKTDLICYHYLFGCFLTLVCLQMDCYQKLVYLQLICYESWNWYSDFLVGNHLQKHPRSVHVLCLCVCVWVFLYVSLPMGLNYIGKTGESFCM